VTLEPDPFPEDIMRTWKLSAVSLIAGLTLASMAVPETVAAADCGGYIACLNDAGAIGSSDAIQETECYGRYWTCVMRQIRTY
jgi:hypothetical protein